MPKDDKNTNDTKDKYVSSTDTDLTPSNIRKKPKRQVAVAIGNAEEDSGLPTITAAGRGKIAEQIMRLADENGIKVREDSALANMLATIELDSPIPSEAFMAVAEILSYVYRANGESNPYDAVFDDYLNHKD